MLGAPSFGDERVYVLECREPALDAVFAQLAQQIVEDLGAAEFGSRDALLRRRLGEWRALLSPQSDGSMSRGDQIGLWGELTVLRRRVEAGAEGVLESWQASSGAPGPDFRWPGVAVEVKSTSVLEGMNFSINGLGQLDLEAVPGVLRLAAVRVVDDPEGMTVPDLVDQLIGLLDPRELLTRLRGRSYQHDPSQTMSWVPFTLAELTVWEILDSTPRLHPGLLPSTWRDIIGEVQYALPAAALGTPLKEADRWWL